MKDWINKLYFKYGDIINIYIYVIFLIIFMFFMKLIGGN